MNNKNTKDELIFTLRFPATSLDPQDFDKLENQIVTSSINATLISVLGSNGVAPSLASSWNNSNNFQKWKLRIHPNKRYSDGTLILPQDIFLNFKRYIYLSKKNNSSSGFLDKLIGYDELSIQSLKTIEALKIEGLKLVGDELEFTFTESMPNFLEKISFGIYAIAHPSSIRKDGGWNKEINHITSGSYKITNWSNKEILLSTVEENTDLYNKVKFIVGFNKENLQNSDMAYASRSSLAFEKNWRFLSRVRDSNIIYIKVMRWDVPGDYWSFKENRQNFRNIYYTYLKKSGVDLSRSFFPVHISGVSQVDLDKKENYLKKKNVVIPPFFDSLKSTDNQEKKDLGQMYKEAIESLCADNDIKLVYADYPEDENKEKNLFDFQFLGTGINIDDPYDDIRFMFLSKEGIQLPFLNKNLKDELNVNVFSVQKINEMIFDEAIIWPILFTSQGIWVNERSRVNHKNLNITKTAIDFSLVKKHND